MEESPDAAIPALDHPGRGIGVAVVDCSANGARHVQPIAGAAFGGKRRMACAGFDMPEVHLAQVVMTGESAAGEDHAQPRLETVGIDARWLDSRVSPEIVRPI
jgi:hypothetical protein